VTLALLTNESESLTVDLTATTYLDTSPIARMIRFTGLADAVPTNPTLEAALADA
jgi:hypothetical protein